MDLVKELKGQVEQNKKLAQENKDLWKRITRLRDRHRWLNEELADRPIRPRRWQKSDQNAVNALTLSRDGNTLVSAGGDHSVRVWNAATGKETTRVWDGSTGRILHILQEHQRDVTSVAISADGKRIVSGSEDQTVKVWDTSTGRDLLTLKGHTQTVTSVAISADGKRIVSGSQDHTVKLWDGLTGKELISLLGHTQPVTSVAISANGKRILSGSADNTVKLWESSIGQELLSLKGHTQPVSSVAISADEKRFLSGSRDNTLKVWDSSTGQDLLTRKGHFQRINMVAISPDGQRIISGSPDNTVKVWDSFSGQELLSLMGHTGQITSLAFSADGKRVLGPTVIGRTLDWDAVTGEVLPDASESVPAAASEASHPSGLHVRVRFDQNGLIQVTRPDLVAAQKERAARERDLLTRWATFDTTWHRGQADFFLQKGDDFAAAFHTGRLLQGQPWDASLHLRQSVLLARLGRRQESATHLMHALFLQPRLDPRSVDVPVGIEAGRLLVRLGRRHEAIGSYALGLDSQTKFDEEFGFASLEYAALLLLAGERDQYRRFRADLVRRAGEMPVGQLQHCLVLAALFAPSEDGMSGRLLSWTEAVARKDAAP
jgi:WD40 repeat protein